MFTCVLKSGGIYNPDHVRRLQEQLDKPLTCLTDIPFTETNVTTIPLKNNWEGWWSKIELFRLDGPIVYMDLDVTVVGDPEKLYRGLFTMWQDPFYPKGFNSSVMAWAETPKHLYHRFHDKPEYYPKVHKRWPKIGDQGYIQDYAGPIQKFDDGLILSYKADVKKGKDPKDAVVIAYHGRPKPWECQ